MISAASVLVCALEVLGRASATLPPIELVAVAPRHASAHVEAFVPPGGRTIFLLTSSAVFEAARDSQCRDLNAVKKLASILVHEQWHVRYGDDERGAYEAQLAALLRFGVDPGSALYYGVVRSMAAVLAARSRGGADRIAAANLR